jgi:hypothetical protein
MTSSTICRLEGQRLLKVHPHRHLCRGWFLGPPPARALRREEWGVGAEKFAKWEVARSPVEEPYCGPWSANSQFS